MITSYHLWIPKGERQDDTRALKTLKNDQWTKLEGQFLVQALQSD